MPTVQQDVLAIIKFQNHGDNSEDTICIFSRAFAKNRLSQEDQAQLDEEPPSGTEEEEEGYRSCLSGGSSAAGDSDGDLEGRWSKFWAENGERLIWESWITRYSAYINPDYLQPEGDQKPIIFSFDDDPKPTPILSRFLSISDEKISEGWNQLSPPSIDCETEAERLINSRCGSYTSSRSKRTVDSMTNVTRMTVSSLELSSSQSSGSLSSVSSVGTTGSSDCPQEDYQEGWNALWKENYEREYLEQYNKFVALSLDNVTADSSETLVECGFSASLGGLVAGLRLTKSEGCLDCDEDERDCFQADLEGKFRRLTMERDQDSLEEKDDEIEDSLVMSTMGLPTSFGKVPGSRKNMAEQKKSGAGANAVRQQVKAALDLIGVEFAQSEETVTGGRVEYKLKHIGSQNKRLKFGTQPKRIENDDEGNEVPSETEENAEVERQSPQKRRKRKRKKKIPYPPEMEVNNRIKKFWSRRFSLFSRFDEGIQLDEESWYSVTPEIVAQHAAERCRCSIIVDAFCGAGGNTIQFALVCDRVIAIDIDPNKIELAKNNARVYGVGHKIDFILGDFLQLALSLKADAVFLSPPWGGVSYASQKTYNLETQLQPVGFSTLFAAASHISHDIAAFLPKNSNTATLVEMAGPGGKVEIEQDFINGRQISITAYFNGLIKE